MKTLKSVFSIMLVAFVIALASCSKSGDPTPATPAQLTALDSVKKAFTGTWDFKSMTVTEISSGKTASTTSCSKAELTSAGYANTNWQKVTPEFKFVYSGATSADGSNDCIGASATYNITAVQNADKSVTLTLDAGGSSAQIYTIKSKDISSSQVTTTFVSVGGNKSADYGYKVTVVFKRS